MTCLCRFHLIGATFGPQEFIRTLKHSKSTSPGLSDTTFFARCQIKEKCSVILQTLLHVVGDFQMLISCDV